MLIIPVLVRIAFITLLERKILGLSQLRLGPNKVRHLGVAQPFRDAIKLFSNQWEKLLSSNTLIFISAPAIAFTLISLLWMVAPLSPAVAFWKLSILLFIVILRLGVYPLLLAGWSSNRKYAIIGRVRGVAQTISYEISLALIIIRVFLLFERKRINEFIQISKRVILTALIPSVGILWLVSIIAETNRTPFDFSEGESELVSGFNIEYASTGFALIFMAEYGAILILSLFTTRLILNSALNSFNSGAILVSLVFLWVWVRATYPRYRYDLLIRLAWKNILPAVLGLLAALAALIRLSI